MDPVAPAFAALAERMSHLPAQPRAMHDALPLATLIARVEIAKQAYRPGVRRASPAAR